MSFNVTVEGEPPVERSTPVRSVSRHSAVSRASFNDTDGIPDIPLSIRPQKHCSVFSPSASATVPFPSEHRHVLTKEEAELHAACPAEADAVELWLRARVYSKWGSAKRQLLEAQSSPSADGTVSAAQLEASLHDMLQPAPGGAPEPRTMGIPGFVAFACSQWGSAAGGILLEPMLRVIDLGPETMVAAGERAVSVLINNENYRWLNSVVHNEFNDLAGYMRQTWLHAGHGSDMHGPLLHADQVWEVLASFGTPVPEAFRHVLRRRYSANIAPLRMPFGLMHFEGLLASLECSVGVVDVWMYRKQLGSLTHGAARAYFKRLDAAPVPEDELVIRAGEMSPDLPPRVSVSASSSAPSSRLATPLNSEDRGSRIPRPSAAHSSRASRRSAQPDQTSVATVMREVLERADVSCADDGLPSTKSDAVLLARRYPDSPSGKVRQCLIRPWTDLCAALREEESSEPDHVSIAAFCKCCAAVLGVHVSAHAVEVMSMLYHDSSQQQQVNWKALLRDVDLSEWPSPVLYPADDADMDEQAELIATLALLHRKWLLRACPLPLAQLSYGGTVSEEEFGALVRAATAVRLGPGTLRALTVQVCRATPAFLRSHSFPADVDVFSVYRSSGMLRDGMRAPRPLAISPHELPRLLRNADDIVRAAAAAAAAAAVAK